MGRLILRADMAMLYVGQQQCNNSGGPKSSLKEKCSHAKPILSWKSLHITGVQKSTEWLAPSLCT